MQGIRGSLAGWVVHVRRHAVLAFLLCWIHLVPVHAGESRMTLEVCIKRSRVQLRQGGLRIMRESCSDRSIHATGGRLCEMDVERGSGMGGGAGCCGC